MRRRNCGRTQKRPLEGIECDGDVYVHKRTLHHEMADTAWFSKNAGIFGYIGAYILSKTEVRLFNLLDGDRGAVDV